MKALSTLIGLAFFLQILYAGFWISGGYAHALVQPALLGIVLFAPIGPTIMAYGLQNTWQTFAAFKYLLMTPSGAINLNALIVITRQLIWSTYAASILAFFFGIFITLGHIDGKIEEIGHHCAASLTGLIYGLLFTEALWRPLKNRLEALHSASTSSARTE